MRERAEYYIVDFTTFVLLINFVMQVYIATYTTIYFTTYQVQSVQYQLFFLFLDISAPISCIPKGIRIKLEFLIDMNIFTFSVLVIWNCKEKCQI